MNYFHHPNLLVQFWASLNTEFDKILDSFVKGDGWLFQDLGVCAKKANIGSIYRCASTSVHNPTHGKSERRDHFIRVSFAILDAAKTQWLAPWRKYVVDPSKGVIPPFFKRQVGGFYLLYMLHSTLPSAGRCTKNPRISMDSLDLIAMHVFITTLRRLPKSDAQFKELTKQFVVLYNDLISSEAFEFCIVNDSFATTNASTRKLLAAKFCTFTKHIYTLKDVRDQLQYITYHESPKVFQSLVAYGRQLTQVQQQMNQSGTCTTDKENVFHSVNEPWTVEQIQELEKETDVGKIAHSIPTILKSLDVGPILSRRRLTGIDDNLLDKELDNCAAVYKTHRKLREMNQQRNEAAKQHRTGGCFVEKELHKRVWKYYVAGDFDWVNQVVSQENNQVHDEDESEITIKPDDAGGQSEGNAMDVDSPDDDEDEGWETEDEDKGNQDEVLSQFGKKLKLNQPEYEKKKESPLKSNPQQCSGTSSMPTILFPDLSCANERFDAAIKLKSSPTKVPSVSSTNQAKVDEAVKTRSGRVVKKKVIH
ncbi:hypothetical protein Ocin01_10798 [Orchesella cincta]|uniref:snRNA-activating protein complex subunit 1 n=1 Tax=Orchesella cincta TaxID=48709 RepID=A0A1D2MSW2_ORCCI|nr:hypothetical protein Ocin01_10798 [Orchesella cincta]